MSTNYSQQSYRTPTWLDELGILLSLPRFTDESYSDYKERLTLQAKTPPDSAEPGFIRSINRLVSFFEDEIFRLTLVLDVNGDPVAPDPYVEVDSTFFRVWSDHTNNVLELELDIYNRDGAYFLKDVYTPLNALAFLNVSIETKKDWAYLRSWHLLYGNSHRFFQMGNLFPTRMNDLPHEKIKSITFNNPVQFLTKVANPDLITEEGEYHIDYTNGILFSYSLPVGGIAYSYREFPYPLIWQPVKIMPLNADYLEHITKDYLINPDGQNERLLLNSYGAQIANETLAIHPLQWGK